MTFPLHRSILLLWLAARSCLFIGLVSTTADALEGEWHAGARLGVGTLRGSSLGPALDIHGGYVLSDMFDLVVQATGSRHDGSSGTDVLSASGGLAYKIDVFEWIPYVDVLGGYYRFDGARGASPDRGGQAGASVHAGIDYLALRQLAFGADFGWHASFQDGLKFPYFTALVGAEYRFGW